MGEVREYLLNIRQLLNLRADTDEESTVESVRKNVNFRSGNAWTLVFAIFIASIGLNTNSAAVIIGAMLISPLMGPIVGAGFALGINDFELLRRSGKNLSQAVLISLATSMIFFLISPFSEAQSELLARTSPTFFDVLIATFGGAAGIVALSRKEKSNAIPGVAIATALMPPLCTAGFGLANGELGYFAGAMYLFVINSVFICISTYIFVRYLNFKRMTYSELSKQKKVERWVLATAVTVIIPSLVLAWFLQQESAFRSKATSFLEKEFIFANSFVMEKKINYNWGKGEIHVGLVGEKLSKAKLNLLEEKMRRYGLAPQDFKINQISLEDRIEKRLSAKLQSKESTLSVYENKILALERKIKEQQDQLNLKQQVEQELKALYPTIQNLVVPEQSEASFLVVWIKPPQKTDKARLEAFIKQRLSLEVLKIEHLKAI